MYKLIAIDLDGTLLNSNHEISEKNKQTIKKCLDKEVKIILLSGREIYSIKEFAKELGIKEYISAYNGGIISDHTGKKVYFNDTLDKSVVKKLIDLNNGREDLLIIFAGDEIIVDNGESDLYKDFRKYTNSTPIVVENIYEYLSGNDKMNNVNKICYSNDHENLLKVRDEVNERVDEDLSTLFSLPIFLEVFNKDVSKGRALEKISSYYDISSDEIIAVGDGENDIAMINYAGLGIAMENASEKLKEVSDYITLGNDRDGLSLALEKFIFNNNYKM